MRRKIFYIQIRISAAFLCVCTQHANVFHNSWVVHHCIQVEKEVIIKGMREGALVSDESIQAYIFMYFICRILSVFSKVEGLSYLRSDKCGRNEVCACAVGCF